MHWLKPVSAAVALAALASACPAEEPKPAPATRSEMKQLLEDWKKAKPRLPLLPLTDEEKAELGDRKMVNNGLMRFKYLPKELRSGDFSREPDPAMTLDNTFKTRIFWIVSRTNNCEY
jgi:hypothetical protein